MNLHPVSMVMLPFLVGFISSSFLSGVFHVQLKFLGGGYAAYGHVRALIIVSPEPCSCRVLVWGGPDWLDSFAAYL